MDERDFRDFCKLCQKSARDKTNSDIDGLSKYVETRFIALEKALNLARVELDRRLEGMNEFREELRRVQSTFVTTEKLELFRKEIDVKREGDNKRISELERSKSNIDGRIWVAVVFIPILINVVMIFLGFSRVWK